MPAFPVCSWLPAPASSFSLQTSVCSVSQSYSRTYASFRESEADWQQAGTNNWVVMRRQFKCVVLLLLLAALSPVVVVATARRELPLMVAFGDEGRQDASSSGTAASTTAEGGEEVIVRRRKDEVVKTNSRRFRRTSSSWKMPAASPRFNFGGRRIPFTADYHSVHRHPPSHN